MAPHSSTLAWKIPWTEEPGRLQTMGSLTVGDDGATSLSPFTFMHWRRKWQPTPVFLPGESQGRWSSSSSSMLSTGFPWWFRGKDSACNLGDSGLIPKLGRSPGEGNEWLPTPLFLPGEFHGQSKLMSYSAWDCEESDMNEQLTHTCSTHLFWFWPLHGFLDLCSPTTD